MDTVRIDEKLVAVLLVLECVYHDANEVVLENGVTIGYCSSYSADIVVVANKTDIEVVFVVGQVRLGNGAWLDVLAWANLAKVIQLDSVVPDRVVELAIDLRSFGSA